MRPVPVLVVLLLLFSLALLCAAPVAGWAAPTVESYKIRLLTGVRSDTPFSSPYTYWAHEVNLRIRDDAGADNITGVTVAWNPDGGPPAGQEWQVRTDDPATYEFLTPTGDGQSVCLSTVWAELAPPTGGSYMVVAHSIDGDSPPITTASVTHWPEPGLDGDGSVWGLSYPAFGSVIPQTDTQPLLTWPAYPGFACEGNAPADGQSLGVLGFDGTCQWRSCDLDPSATAIAYGTGGAVFSPSLEPGRSYAINLGESRGPVWLGGDPGGCLEEIVRVASPFTIDSPLPTIQTADVWRWRCLCPDPGNVESLCEGARVSALDLDGWQDVSVTTQTPDGLQLPDPLGWDCSTNDGPYLLSQTCGHNAPGLNPGRYTITAGDAAGATVSLVSGQASQVPPLHQITSPSNGAVLAETELTPTFSWESAPGAAFACVCVKDRAASDAVIWVKRDIPGAVTSAVYNDDGQGPPLVPGGRYLVVVRVHYPDEDAGDGVGIDTLTGTAANFSIYSPVPVIQSADICRARCLCSDPDSTEFYHEGARISVLDLDGWSDVSVSTVTPDGLTLPDPLGCDNTTNDGCYTLNTKNAHNPAALGAGRYTITATDTAGVTVSMTSGPVSEVPPMHQITYPANGALLPEGELTPVLSWTGATGAEYACVCVSTETNGAPIWVRRDVPGDVTSVVYNDDGTGTPLSPGGRYRVQVRVHYPDEDPEDGVAVDTFTATNATFATYSPIPAITRLEVRRGYDVSPEGAIGYRQRAVVFASDGDGAADIASVSLTDSQGLQHDAWWVCDQDQTTAAFCWDASGEATPSPAGAYTATVTDQGGNVGAAVTQVSALPTDPGFVPVPSTPANDSVATATPEFSWSAPLGEGCYCLTMWEPNGPCQVWCPWLVSSPIGYGGADLLPGHLYDWGLSSFNLDPIAQSDPAAVSRFHWSVTSRFWVEPKFVGFLDPVNDDGSSIFRLGATVPVKFQLIAADGSQVTDASCELHVAKVTDDIMGTYEEAVSTSAADSGSSFRYVDDHYQFNLGTKLLSEGTYRLRVTVNGASAHETTISLK